MTRALHGLDPETTLVVVISKTFTTAGAMIGPVSCCKMSSLRVCSHLRWFPRVPLCSNLLHSRRLLLFLRVWHGRDDAERALGAQVADQRHVITDGRFRGASLILFSYSLVPRKSGFWLLALPFSCLSFALTALRRSAPCGGPRVVTD